MHFEKKKRGRKKGELVLEEFLTFLRLKVGGPRAQFQNEW